MIAKYFAALIAAATLAAPALAETKSFTHEGETYVYSVDKQGSRTVLKGKVLPSGKPFRLEIRGNRVRGTANHTPVSFSLADVKPIVNAAAATGAAD